MTTEPVESTHAGDVGERIRRYRQERSLSLTQLAQEAGVSKGYLSALENNPASRRPSAETLYGIAKALGVTMSDLLGRKLLSTPSTQVPEGLREFADQENLPEADVRMLSAIQFRGEPPRTKERWQYIYTAIRTSESMDGD
ncbi:helix-turn-helix transcriptional regulator [Actinacidiphila alni]|uniref:helix-turn-helix domain-containing protein n=1 Tax=Actinacidiphila alni TaxID=380248 RepID=UPI0033C9359D